MITYVASHIFDTLQLNLGIATQLCLHSQPYLPTSVGSWQSHFHVRNTMVISMKTMKLMVMKTFSGWSYYVHKI